MTANIFGNRFYGLRAPAWHGLGIVSEEELSATKALEAIGSYNVRMESLQTESGIKLSDRVILRDPTPDDNVVRPFGIVGPDYTLITPSDAVAIWDEHVGQPVETVGVLGNGEKLFITTKLPDMNVRGDEISTYLMHVSAMTGGEADRVVLSPVRTVCQNTLSLALDLSTEMYRVVHDQTVKVRIAEWLSGVYERAIDRMEAVQEAFDILANTSVVTKEAKSILEETYIPPKLPRRDVPETVFAQRMANYEINLVAAAKSKDLVLQLFDGAATGADSKAFAGTAWGLYNSVVEFEDYKRSGGSTPDLTARVSTLFGERAKTKTRAFTASYDFSKAKANRKSRKNIDV